MSLLVSQGGQISLSLKIVALLCLITRRTEKPSSKNEKSINLSITNGQYQAYANTDNKVLSLDVQMDFGIKKVTNHLLSCLGKYSYSQK